VEVPGTGYGWSGLICGARPVPLRDTLDLLRVWLIVSFLPCGVYVSLRDTRDLLRDSWRAWWVWARAVLRRSPPFSIGPHPFRGTCALTKDVGVFQGYLFVQR
jgi:hypothetical protein